MSCPNENTILDFAAGRLTREQVAQMQGHVDGCSTCRQLLADSIRGDVEPGSPTESSHGSLPGADAISFPRGTRVGRYVLLGTVGAGGMGRVYAAYDPQLDRRVALKVLKPGQLVREGAVDLRE